jgi:hypothetical protein
MNDNRVEQLLNQFANEMHAEGIGIREVTFELITFAARAVAASIACFDAEEDYDQSLRVITQLFHGQAKLCLCKRDDEAVVH